MMTKFSFFEGINNNSIYIRFTNKGKEKTAAPFTH